MKTPQIKKMRKNSPILSVLQTDWDLYRERQVKIQRKKLRWDQISNVPVVLRMVWVIDESSFLMAGLNRINNKGGVSMTNIRDHGHWSKKNYRQKITVKQWDAIVAAEETRV